MSNRDPLNSGLSNRYIDGQNFIVGPAWERAAESKQIVGTCRALKCDGLLQARPPREVGKRVWYEAVCLSCGHEIASMDGGTLPRSSRREEMPGGAWERREEHLRKLKELTRPQEGAGGA